MSTSTTVNYLSASLQMSANGEVTHQNCYKIGNFILLGGGTGQGHVKFILSYLDAFSLTRFMETSFIKQVCNEYGNMAVEESCKDQLSRYKWKEANKLHLNFSGQLKPKEGDYFVNIVCQRGKCREARILVETIYRDKINVLSHEGFYQITGLGVAARNGNRKMVELLLKKGADVNKADNKGRTPLWFALGGWGRAQNYSKLQGYKETINLLLNHGADVKKEDVDSGITPLFIVIRDQQRKQELKMNMVELLLKKGADVNKAIKNYRRTGLIVASERGNIEMVNFLLKKGAEIDKADNEGRTALWFAAFDGNGEMVELLLKKGADVNKADDEGRTPLWFASQNGKIDTVKLLLNCKTIEINKADNRERTPLHISTTEDKKEIVDLLLNKGADVNKADIEGRTALMIAVSKGYTGIVQSLLNKGADVNKDCGTYRGRTALKIAMESRKDEIAGLLLNCKTIDVNKATTNENTTVLHCMLLKFRFNMVKLLLENDADVDKATSSGKTPLMLVTCYQGTKYTIKPYVELLLENGADVNKEDCLGETVFMMASKNDDKEIVELLLNHKKEIDVNKEYTTCDDYLKSIGDTALMLAIKHCYTEIVELLLNHEKTKEKIDVNKVNMYGKTSLMFAITHCHWEITELLLNKGADFDKADQFGWTALMLAIKHRRIKIIGLLLNKGADVNKTTTNGETALTLATESPHIKIIELLSDPAVGINTDNEKLTLQLLRDNVDRVNKKRKRS